MNGVSKNIILVLAFVLLAGIATSVVLSTHEFDDFRNKATNTIIDVSGVKDKIEAELRDKGGRIAEEYGVPQSVVTNMIDELAISDWEAATLPEDATSTGTYNIETDSVAAKLTTYDDPNFVTINAYGQTVTMQVPASAQTYLPLLDYL